MATGAIDILCGIVQAGMDLPESRVVIYDQRYEAPKDEGIYVVVSFVSSRVVGTRTVFNAQTDEEEQEVVIYETCNVDVVSRSPDALYRYHEVFMAIDGSESQRLQEQNGVRIFRTGGATDLSAVEASAPLHRYQIPVIISSVKRRTVAAMYFDKFSLAEGDINE